MHPWKLKFAVKILLYLNYRWTSLLYDVKDRKTVYLRPKSSERTLAEISNKSFPKTKLCAQIYASTDYLRSAYEVEKLK